MNRGLPREFSYWLGILFVALVYRLANGESGSFDNGHFLKGDISPSISCWDDGRTPAVCGVGRLQVTASAQFVSSAKKPPPPPPPPPVLPNGMRMWETIPGVIRNNGTDTCRVEVNVNGAVSNVAMQVAEMFLSESGQTNITLHDDGLNGDRVAGDDIYTSELIRFDTNQDADLAPYYEYDTNSPAGLMPYSVGTVTVDETNGTQSRFLINPEAGILNKDIPLVQTVQLSSNVVISPHLINVLGTNLFTQKMLREYSYDAAELPRIIYSDLPDAFDFFVYFSTYRVEYVPYDTYYNGIVGAHYSIQINFTGTGQSEYDNSAVCGSAGRLLGINALDTYERGMSSGTCTHEIMHQWGSYMAAFPFSDGQHYVDNCNADSPLGGGLWDDNGNGTWTVDCNAQQHLDIFDQYLMGLVPANQVTPLRVYSQPFPVFCGGLITNVISTNTIQDIVNTYGLRTPGPATARHNFSIGFVAESYQRLLTPVEMTYYDIFAAQYTRPIPAGQPDPYIHYGWESFSRFYGGGTTWSSDVLSLIQPVIQSFQWSPDGQCTITGKGLANHTYRVEASTNLQSWTTVTNQISGTNGLFSLLITNSSPFATGFYRLAWP